MTILVGGGGGVSPPTSLQNAKVAGAASFNVDLTNMTGASQSSTITSATLTEVLNISGPGVLEFSALVAAGSASSHNISMVIDGVTALNETSGV